MSQQVACIYLDDDTSNALVEDNICPPLDELEDPTVEAPPVDEPPLEEPDGPPLDEALGEPPPPPPEEPDGPPLEVLPEDPPPVALA
jgi:hypothetical protein